MEESAFQEKPERTALRLLQLSCEGYDVRFHRPNMLVICDIGLTCGHPPHVPADAEDWKTGDSPSFELI